MPGEQPNTPRRQCAALAFQPGAGGIRVMLVTSRGTGRWVLPKGWAKQELSGAENAALEAFEEAGLKGAVTAGPIGAYRAAKQLDDGASIPCIVDVFALCVDEVLEDWPERAQRQLRWCHPAEAALLVQETELIALLLRLAEPGVVSPC